MTTTRRISVVLLCAGLWLSGVFVAIAMATEPEGPLVTWAVFSVGSSGHDHHESAEATPWTEDQATLRRCSLEELRVRVVTGLRDHHEDESGARDRRDVMVELLDLTQADYHRRRVVAHSPMAVESVVVNADDTRSSPPPPHSTTNTATDTTTTTAPIACELDAEFCTPRIIGIRLPDVREAHETLGVNHTIRVEFAAPTTMPAATTTQDLGAFIQFPCYIGDAHRGQWVDARTLEIIVLELDPTRILPLRELMTALVGTTLVVQPPSPSPSSTTKRRKVQGHARFRIQREGRYALRLRLEDEDEGDGQFAGDRGAVSEIFHAAPTALSPVFVVKRCSPQHPSSAAPSTARQPNVVVVVDPAEAIVVDDDGNADDGQDPTLRGLPRPVLTIEGVLSHAGAEGFVLPHREIAMREPGTWGLNFWLWTEQDATGAFRTLFFNGDGTGEHRTPSAWFRPDDRRLVLRVSTAENMDLGLDSQRELPLRQWVNVGVTFRNCSSGVDGNATVLEGEHCGQHRERPWFYAIELVIDGRLDQVVKVFTPVHPNAGPLHVGKGPWTDGLRGFVSDLRVFAQAPPVAAHRRLYARDRARYGAFEDPQECVTAAATSPKQHLDAVGQLGFLTHCLEVDEKRPATALAEDDETKEQGGVVCGDNADAVTSKVTFDHAQTLLENCDPRAWDVLLEAAELGHAPAHRDVGRAYLFGALAFPAGVCSHRREHPIELDPMRARHHLELAVRQRQWDAAALLVLVSTAFPAMTSTTPRNELLDAAATMRVGLYHLAALSGDKAAFAVLGRMYTAGDGALGKNPELAAFHYHHAAVAASIAFHARGQQPLHEMNRLYDGITEDIGKGQRGDDDELIQYQKLRADQHGDVEAMANMGDLYYWGARGLPRDHAQAYEYFRRAAEAGHTSAQSAVAGMLLKGEGTTQDNATAIAWYEKAAARNHTRALNGIGFIHFHGTGGMPENKTLALAFFERAAANEEDGDSIFNAGYCHAHGLGTSKNMTRAIDFYGRAAQKFGHFDAIFEMGKVHMLGHSDGIPRNSERAVAYFKAASEAGQWGRSVRQGFDYYLAHDYRRSAVRYHEAREYGYSVATSNLAYLYDMHLRASGKLEDATAALTFLLAASKWNRDREVLVRIGDYHFYGLGGLETNPIEALRWYSRASAEGIEAGAYNVGHMHEYGQGVPVNLDRAERYYNRVLEISPDAINSYIAIRLALIRLRIRRIWQSWFGGRRVDEQPEQSPSFPDTKHGEANHVPERWRDNSTITSVCFALAIIALGTCLVRMSWQQTTITHS